MFKKILFTTTVSPDCDDAAKYAFDIAKKTGATLYIMHVFGTPSHGYSHFIVNIKTGEKEAYSDEYDAVVREEIKKVYAEQFEQYNKVKIECTIGSPSTEILRFAKKEQIDLVVMGAHQQVQNADALHYRNVTGDTMQKVAKSSRCPVVIISRPYERNLWALNNILCGTDFKKASMPAFRFALRLAKESKCKLHLFHAVDLGGQQFGKVPTQQEVETKIKEAKEKMQEIYISELEGYKNYETAIWEGIPYMEILKYAREKEIDLIAMAHHTGSIFQKKEVMGSTIEEVVLRSACPVASVNRIEVLDEFQGYLA